MSHIQPTGARCVSILLCLLMLIASASAALSESALPAGMVPLPLDAETGYVADQANYLSETHYLDETLEVNITTDRYLDSTIWIAEVHIVDPSQLRTAFCGSYSSGKTAGAAKIANRVNAVFACNGDYYSYHFDTGVVIRNGKQYRKRPNKKNDVLLIDTQGNLSCVISPTKDSFEEVYTAMGGPAEEGGTILHAFTFGPALVVDGEPAHDEFVRPDNGHKVMAQRTVIAQKEPLTYLFISCSGPESQNSRGMTLDEMAAYVHSLGVTTAYNLDGGSSSTLVFNGEKINSLDTGKVRPVSDIIYFSTGFPDY